MSKKSEHNLSKTLQVGIVVGFVSTAIGNFLAIITQSIGGTFYVETSVAAVTMFSISAAVVSSIFYHFLLRQTDYARDILTIIGLSIPTLLAIYVVTNDYYDTPFKVISVCVAYVIFLTIIILTPWLSLRIAVNKAHKK